MKAPNLERLKRFSLKNKKTSIARASVTKRIIEPRKEFSKFSRPADKLISLKEAYNFTSNKVKVIIRIYSKKGDYVPTYEVDIPQISINTEIVLEKIRQELISEVSLGILDILSTNKKTAIEDRFREAIEILIEKYFPDASKSTLEILEAYLIQKSLGLGDIETIMHDEKIEEIAVNSPNEPIWVYHISHGWLKTNIILESDDQIKHYASTIGRKIGRQITILTPLMDANMGTGDRVNATLAPISLRGNTITFRKFSAKPWTITDFLMRGTIEPFAAAMIWTAVQYEMSILIAGGSASGKTSMLNVLSNFFPPNQRIISIEDTHELQLPKFLHWVPLITRLPNIEGKGEISMLDLLINSLRMRPDRILVGEIRRKQEAEVLFEAIHTGHSVYATIHANNVKEAITRVTSPPIDVPKSMLPAISLFLIQYRNRRTGVRKTFQIAEVLPDSTANVLVQADLKKNRLVKVNDSKSFMDSLQLYTGMTSKEIFVEQAEKERILKWLVKHKVNTVDNVGQVMAEYYINHDQFMKLVKKGQGPNFVS